MVKNFETFFVVTSTQSIFLSNEPLNFLLKTKCHTYSFLIKNRIIPLTKYVISIIYIANWKPPGKNFMII